MNAQITGTPLLEGKRAPFSITATNESQRLHEFVAANLAFLTAKLTEHGAILFRGFGIDDATKFADFVAATGGRSTPYRFGSTPRRRVAGDIYTSTEYPAHREIPLHNENAYHTVWPRKLAFCCVTAAAEGGETPIADLRDVSRRLPPQLMDRLESVGVRYIRHFHEGIDLPWTDVFQTSDRAELARICAANAIQHEWVGADARVLRTTQDCQGVIHDPVTGERLFFNQAHLFHATSMGQAVAEAMRAALGADHLPRHARYADGTEIPDEDVVGIHQAFREHATVFPWQRGDVLWIDNMQLAHGRRPFQGERKVLAALLDSSAEAQ
jgi:alpha-ketoglutarate-dependent taurine dioxygenase